MRYFFSLIICLLIVACASEPGFDWKELDLTGHRVAVSIMAPDSAKVASKSLSGVIQDVTIKSTEDNYSVQVLGSRAATNDMAKLKAEQLDLVRSNPYFERVIVEEPNGFIYENMIDTTAIYGFRYIIYQGDQEFVFQNGLEGTFGLEAIEAMYAAVKQEK